MINLERKVSGYNCYDQIISSIMGYFDCEAEMPMILCYRWWFDFYYDNSEELIGNRIIYNKGSRAALEYIAGIHSEELIYSDINEFINTVKNDIEEGNPLLAFVDGYYSSWDIHYHKIHGDHAVVIIGIDTDKEVIYCSDRYYSNKIEIVPFADLQNWVQSCKRFQAVTKPRRLSLEERESMILSHMNDMRKNEVFNKIRNFAEYVRSNINLEKEFFAYDNFEKTPFVIALNDIGYGRESFSRTLDSIKVKYRKYELDYFVDSFEQVGRRWRDLGLLICKYIATKNKKFDVDKMAQVIIGLADKEETLFNELYGYLNGKVKLEIPTFEEFDWSAAKGDVIQLDVTNLMNNRAFAKKVDNDEKANFNDSDEFMALQNPLVEHSVVLGDTMLKVKIDDFSSQYDNFGCDEQVFTVEPGYYSAIYVVATAQYVNQKSNIMVRYDDGTNANLPFCVTDWRTEKVFGEQIAYEATSCRIVNNEKNIVQGNAYLYLQGIKLDSTRKISGFTLPYHPNIRIFALALRK